MKWIRELIIIILLVLLGFMLHDFLNQKEELTDVNQQLKKWQEAYAELADTHDTLDSAYALLKEEFRQMDSMYKKKLLINIIEYEKDMAAFDTLSVDEHIQLLSNYLSEEDSISK